VTTGRVTVSALRDDLWTMAATPRLSETVAERIRVAIASGALRPGDRIIEADIAAGLNVSKSPVREALRDLEREGLVEVHPRRGSYVRVITVQDAREIRELRVLLETFAVRSALGSSSPDWIDDLRASVRRMRASGDRTQLNQEHLAFHDVVLTRTHNRRVVEILHGLRSQLETLLAFIDLLYDGPEAVADDHERLVDALVDGGDDVVTATVDAHIRVAGQRLEAIWETAGDPPRVRRPG
jgi:DNA-binding GntR family transcriptional regulator